MSNNLQSKTSTESPDLTTIVDQNQGGRYNSSYVPTKADITNDITPINVDLVGKRIKKLRNNNDITDDIVENSDDILDDITQDEVNDVTDLDYQIEKSGFRLDWISFTVDLPQPDNDDEQLTTDERLEPVFSFFSDFDIELEDFEPCKSQNFYNAGLGYGSGFLKVMYNDLSENNANPKNNTTANIIITGQGCSFMYEQTTAENKEYYILSKVDEYARSITRLDIALDIVEPNILDLEEIGAKLDKNHCVTTKRSKNVVKEDDGQGNVLGHTRYIGSKKSGEGVYGRFYNKMAQATSKGLQLVEAVKQSGIWDRYELSINGNERCSQVVHAFLYDKEYLNDIDKIYKSLIAELITFKDKTYSQRTGRLLKKKEDWKTSDFWTNFLEGSRKFKFNSSSRDPQFKEILAWISASVMPSILVLDEILQQYDKSIFDELKNHSNVYERSKKQELAIKNAIKLPIDEINGILDDFKAGHLRKSYIKKVNRRVTVNGKDIQKK